VAILDHGQIVDLYAVYGLEMDGETISPRWQCWVGCWWFAPVWQHVFLDGNNINNLSLVEMTGMICLANLPQVLEIVVY